MQTIHTELETLLKKDKRLVADGKLMKNKVIEFALKLDKELLKLLKDNKSVKNHFFQEVDSVLVFDKVKFQDFVNLKSFLADSYTKYKSKIGLEVDGDYLSKSKDVVLVWPYKDCLLEGGQTKAERENRSEIFWNETLAPEHYDRLLSPKAFTNFKKYDSKGEHELKDKIDFGKENLIIKGNNLLALHSLKERFEGKIKLIYIDPPYNTEGDDFAYNDTFKHSTWLTFIKNRLEIAKELLKDEGAIFISIDDIEHAYLKILCDEIFERENFLASIAYERSGVSGLGQGGGFVVNTHESILCYAKDKSKFKAVDLTGEGEFGYEEMKRYNKILGKVGEGKEVARFVAPSTKEEVIIYKHKEFEIETISMKDFKKREDEIYQSYLKNFDKVFRNTSIQEENEFQTKILSYCTDGFYSADYLVSRGKFKGQQIKSYFYNNQVFVWLRESAKIVSAKEIVKTNKLSDFWEHASIPKADLANEGGVKLRRGKKPENLLKRIISMITEPDELVMDFFSGSGTTSAVCHKLGRQYIGLEQLDYKENDSVIRLNNVIKGDTSGISTKVNWKGGGSFIYCELAKDNAQYIDKIEKAKKTEELKKLWAEMQKEGFISHRIKESEVFNEGGEIKWKDLSLDEQKQILIRTLDLNHLYINYSEMEDERYKKTMDDETKNLNKQFYSAK